MYFLVRFLFWIWKTLLFDIHHRCQDYDEQKSRIYFFFPSVYFLGPHLTSSPCLRCVKKIGDELEYVWGGKVSPILLSLCRGGNRMSEMVQFLIYWSTLSRIFPPLRNIEKRDYSLTSWPEFSVIIYWQNKPFRVHVSPQDFVVPLLVSGSQHVKVPQVLEETLPWSWNHRHVIHLSWWFGSLLLFCVCSR